MKGLQTIVITMGVMIILATTALVVLVVKKSSRGANGGVATGGANNPTVIRGDYITSYGVGDNIAVVLDNSKGQKTINLYDGKNLQLLSTLVIDKQ
ncbi:MAG: hypothetical protein QM529_06400 [Hydrotalea sp.]|nr:hypothetical protein [Hydrotalea sp.]